MYDLDIKPEADKIFRKLSKKNKTQLILIHKKIDGIRSNPTHNYKFLVGPLNGFSRVHIDGSFVLIFKVEHKRKTVIIFYYAHHDEIYNWRPN